MKHPVIYETHVRNHTAEGTFETLSDDLERIRRLGVDILWLMPIHPIGEKGRKGTFGSPYAIQDYRSISSDLGTEEDFREFLSKAHSLGLKVIIDVVFNHSAMDNLLVQSHPEWYLKDESGQLTRKIPEWTDVYDLDFSVDGVSEYLIQSLKKWVLLGVDGFRCDVAALVPLDFWKRASLDLGTIKPLIWLAESVEKTFIRECRDRGITAHSDPELHQVFSISYDHDGYDYLLDYFEGKRPLQSYLDHLFVQETMFPQDAIKLRFLENHDRPRAADWISGSNRLRNWTVFYLCLQGASLVYMGQELGLNRCPDFFEKDPVPWNDGQEDFLQFFSNVLSISRGIKDTCIRFRIRQIASGVVHLCWSNNNTEYNIYCNLESRFGETGLSGSNLLKSDNKDETFRYQDFPLIIKSTASGKE